MTLERIDALRERWRECPPVDRSSAAAIGYKPKGKRAHDDGKVQSMLMDFPLGYA
jgi:hypothetical protein